MGSQGVTIIGGPMPNGCLYTGGIPRDVLATPVLVSGTRTFDDYDLLSRKMEKITYWIENVEVVIGSAGTVVEKDFERVRIGADGLAFRWAEWMWWTRKIFWADWSGLGKAAGPRRNREMARYVAANSGFAVFFWDGRSPGTKNCIEEFLSVSSRDRLRIIRIDRY